MRYFPLFFLLVIFCFGQEVEKKKTPKVGLVLSGGGAKGYAHIGALKIIEKAGIKIDYVTGTSMGAIVGGLYASGYNPAQLDSIITNIDFSKMFLADKNRNFVPFFDKTYKERYILDLPFDNFKLQIPHAITKGQGALDILTGLFRHVNNIDDFDKLPIPFRCITTNIETGKSIVLNHGSLPRAVLASGAYPSLVEPVDIDGVMCVDGGISNNFPVQQVRDMGADIVIGIDLDEGLYKKEDITSITKVIEQIVSYSIEENSNAQRKLVDLNIRPDLKGFSVTSFDEKIVITTKGELAANLVYKDLEEIAKRQGYPTQIEHKKNIAQKNNFFIDEYKFSGLKRYF